MSRSYRKHPAMGICKGSNKKARTLANRLFRKRSKRKIKKGEEPLYCLREVSDVWEFPTDGLAIWWGKDLDQKYLRK